MEAAVLDGKLGGKGCLSPVSDLALLSPGKADASRQLEANAAVVSSPLIVTPFNLYSCLRSCGWCQTQAGPVVLLLSLSEQSIGEKRKKNWCEFGSCRAETCTRVRFLQPHDGGRPLESRWNEIFSVLLIIHSWKREANRLNRPVRRGNRTSGGGEKWLHSEPSNGGVCPL